MVPKKNYNKKINILNIMIKFFLCFQELKLMQLQYAKY